MPYLLLLVFALSLHASNCQKAFPSVLSSETSVSLLSKINVEQNSSSLTTPVLYQSHASSRCNQTNCEASETAGIALPVFTPYVSEKSNTLSITHDVTFIDSDIPNLTIDADNLTIIFDAPIAVDGHSHLQKIGAINDKRKNTTYIFAAGDYHLKSWNVDNTEAAQAQNSAFKDTLLIKSYGNARLFIKEDLTFKKQSVPNPNQPAIEINKPDGRSLLMFYVRVT